MSRGRQGLKFQYLGPTSSVFICFFLLQIMHSHNLVTKLCYAFSLIIIFFTLTFCIGIIYDGDRWNNLYTKPCCTPRPDLNQKHLIFKANTLPLNQQQNSGPISIRCIYEGILKYLNMSQLILALELVRMIATSCICLRLMSEKSAIEIVELFFLHCSVNILWRHINHCAPLLLFLCFFGATVMQWFKCTL